VPPKLRLIIFDCDGVLVDSEPLAIRVLVDGLAAIGYGIEEASASERFLGRNLAAVQATLREELGFDLPAERLDRMRRNLFDLFRRELKPMPGVFEALDRLTIPCCVASSSLPDRLRLALEVTGLLPRFEPHLYSANMVAEGKPAPDLFLHAAAGMGASPEVCLVIEDSAPGIEAARRAGMTVFAFTGGGHARGLNYRQSLEALSPAVLFDDMRKLPALIEGQRAG
jgi:HAD superfamily hydrolase (TIGR01509 family)